MAHYAKVLDNKVIQVIVAEKEFFDSFIDSSPGEWIQTSYNTIQNRHTNGGTPLRGNYASIGFIYDREHDVFYPPSPFPSWTLSHDTWSWIPPVSMPVDDNLYHWNEEILNWEIIPKPEV